MLRKIIAGTAVVGSLTLGTVGLAGAGLLAFREQWGDAVGHPLRQAASSSISGHTVAVRRKRVRAQGTGARVPGEDGRLDQGCDWDR